MPGAHPYAGGPEKIISMAQLVKNTEQIARDIETTGTRYRIKRPGGKQGMLLIDAEYYESWRAAIELMKQPDWRAQWDRARQERTTGLGRTVDELAQELGLDRPAQPKCRSATTRAAPPRRTKGARRNPRARGRPEQRP